MSNVDLLRALPTADPFFLLTTISIRSPLRLVARFARIATGSLRFFLLLLFLLGLPFAAVDLRAETILPPGFEQANPFVSARWRLVSGTPTVEELMALSVAELEKVGPPLRDGSPGVGQDPSFGYTKQSLVLVLKLDNRSGRSDFFLQTGLPRHEYTLLVSRQPDGQRLVREAGAAFPFEARPVPAMRATFDVWLPPGKSELRLIMRSRDTLAPVLRLMSPQAFYAAQNRDHLWHGALFGVLLIIGAYNFLIFFSTRERVYAYYTLLTLAACLYFSNISGYSFRFLWPQFPTWALHSAIHTVGLYVFALLLFARKFLGLSERLPVSNHSLHVLQWLAPVVSVLSWYLPFGPVASIMVVLVLMSLLLLLLSALRLVIQRAREAYFFVGAFFLFLAGAVTFALRAVGVLPLNFVTFHGVELGSVAELLLLSLALADRLRTLQDQVRARMMELQIAYRRMGESERRYRHLVEGTSDIIFSLNENLEIETLSSAFYKVVGLSSRDWIGRPFSDLLYVNTGERSIEHIVAAEKLRLLVEGQSVFFRAEWRTKRGEPRMLSVSMEPVALETEVVYFGRATSQGSDELLPFLVLETRRYLISNYFSIGELIGDSLSAGLEKYGGPEVAHQVRLGLREILVNAIEHGSLSITYEQKSAALEAGSYFDLLQERQNDPRYRDRMVSIDYALNSKRAYYRITDEGAGFDHRKMLARDIDEINATSAPHGRGLMLTRNYFDVVRYNERGNQVVLIRQL